jgi:hypothetical protein
MLESLLTFPTVKSNTQKMVVIPHEICQIWGRTFNLKCQCYIVYEWKFVKLFLIDMKVEQEIVTFWMIEPCCASKLRTCLVFSILPMESERWLYVLVNYLSPFVKVILDSKASWISLEYHYWTVFLDVES